MRTLLLLIKPIVLTVAAALSLLPWSHTSKTPKPCNPDPEVTNRVGPGLLRRLVWTTQQEGSSGFAAISAKWRMPRAWYRMHLANAGEYSTDQG